MNEVSWQNGPRMMANGPHEMAGRQNNNNVPGCRSQDDATVGYFFQRPQNDSELNAYANKRWAIGDDSIIEHVRKHLATLQYTAGVKVNSLCVGKGVGVICFEM